VRARRGILSAFVVTVVLVLSGCAGLPTSGPVNEGREAGTDAGTPDFSFVPDRPQAGASPEQIVEGFIRAGSGPGPGADWETARLFLAPSIRETWQPEASVTIDLLGDREYVSPTAGVVSMSLVAVATVDEAGSYEPSDAAPIPLSFELAQQDDGEWRITEAPDGIVLDRDNFARVFHRYSLMYFDPTWQYLVPDLRWFAATNAAARITAALVDGPPSSWLVESVRNAFPESVEAQPSVPIESGIAQVELSGNALSLDQPTLDRMQTQLTASLATASIAGAQMLVSSAPLDADPVPITSTRVTGPPLVETAEGFGFISGDELTPIAGLSDTMPGLSPAPASIQVAAQRDLAAVRLTDGTVARIAAAGDVAVVDTRGGLVDPSVDSHGLVWSVPRDTPGAVEAFSRTERFPVADAWPGATQIIAMAVSRDGARVAALVVSGGTPALWIAGVLRDAENQPLRLGPPVSLGAVPGTGAGIAWVDDTTIGVLSVDPEGSIVTEQLVGGPSTSTDAPSGVVGIAGATSISTVRVRAEDGSLYVKRGSNWSRTAAGILVLATQQGSPG
jgi:Lipoprotein LpqB beta-propeller domain